MVNDLRNLLKQLIFLGLDGIGISISIILALLLKFGNTVPQDNLRLFLDYYHYIVFFLLLFFIPAGMYRFRDRQSYLDTLYKVIWTNSLAILAITLGFLMLRTYYRPDLNTSREVLFILWVLLIVYTATWRFAYHKYQEKRGWTINTALVIGTPNENLYLAKALGNATRTGYEVLGFILPAYATSSANSSEQNIVGNISELSTIVTDKNVQDIIIAGNLSPIALLETIDQCSNCGCRVWIYPSLYEVMIGRLQIQEIGGIPLIEVNPSPLTGWYGYIKRGMDLLAAGIGLVLAIPLAIIVITAIKMDSPGPIFYSQKRLGKNGKPIFVHKFRTMRQDAEKATGAVLAQANDPRITRIGKFLRKTRLDEIPQLWCVFNGDMSLIGPRPERPELMEKYKVTSPHFHRRLAVRPGLTGLAQIQGAYDLDIESKLRYDLTYIYNVNMLLDIKILLATVKVVFTGKGAM